MKIKKYLSIFISIILTFLFVVNVYAFEPYTGNQYEYHVWLDDWAVENDTCMQKKTDFKFRFETNGVQKTATEARRMVFQGVDKVWWSELKVIGCEECEKYITPDLYSVRTFLVDDNGKELVSRKGLVLDKNALDSTGLDFEHYNTPLRICIEVAQKPGRFCSNCNHHIGDIIEVNTINCHRTCLVVSKYPNNCEVEEGDTATFDIAVSKYAMTHTPDPRSFYKWAVKNKDTGEYIWLGDYSPDKDYTAPYNLKCTGTSTPNLTIQNVSKELDGLEFACGLNGTYGKIVYAGPAKLTVKYDQVAGDTNEPEVPDEPSETIVSGEIPSQYKISIPKSITLSGDTKKANYRVKVQGDMADTDKITITPDSSVILSTQTSYTNKKANQTGTITQDKTEWVWDNVDTDAIGSIVAEGLTAGRWNGNFNFNISYE